MTSRLIACLSLLLVLFCSGCATNPATTGPELAPKTAALSPVASFADQVTGVAVASNGRIFVSFPRWWANPRYSVAELLPDGSLRPFPSRAWNQWDKGADPASHFVCVQSVYVDDDEFLWILDPASPSFSGVVPGGAKLLRVNLATDQVEQVIRFPESVAPRQSYLNDVRVDVDDQVAYLTESGLGALIVVDLTTGESRRVLADHPSTKAEPGFVPVIEGKELRDQQGKPPQVHADGIALNSDGSYLYYHALTGRTLYRIKTDPLKDPHLARDLGSYVEKVAVTGAADGMAMDDKDTLYVTSLEDSSVRYYRDPQQRGTVVISRELRWPDSLSIGPDQYLYITASQIQGMPRYNQGVDRRTPPYQLFKVWIAPFP